MSSHTILSYRDSFKLLLVFLSQQKNIPVTDLTIENIGIAEIIAFLDYLERERKNGIGTRNIRLSALHSFFRYLAGMYPEHLDQSQRILSIPFKRMSTRTIDYLDFDEIMAVFKTVDRSKFDGRRDYALLWLMFNTGARVQEILDLKGNDLQLSKPFSVHIFGKGQKERICPIWSETAQILREYVEELGIDLRKPVPIFMNHLGRPLTRFGVRYILEKYLQKAASVQPSLKKKRLHPHSMRHSTAVHLLKSGVDLSSIAHWLGHVSPNTTNKYATMDIEMKQQAIEKAKPLCQGINPQSSWRKDPDILAWLESLAIRSGRAW
jgi:site-specific recombinase XerD